MELSYEEIYHIWCQLYLDIKAKELLASELDEDNEARKKIIDYIKKWKKLLDKVEKWQSKQYKNEVEKGE